MTKPRKVLPYLGMANKTYSAEEYVWRSINYRDDPSRNRWNRTITFADAIKLLREIGVVDVQLVRNWGKYTSHACYVYANGQVQLCEYTPAWVVVHEAAHHRAHRSGENGHGPLFRAHYIDLLRKAHGGIKWANRLEKAFRLYGLKVATLPS